MKHILNISTECYPAAKAGGMGDVLGSLPIYTKTNEYKSSVVIPKYKTTWIENQVWKPQYKGVIKVGKKKVPFNIERLKRGILPYVLYAVNIVGKFDRTSIYLNENGVAFEDENERYILFQTAVCEWLLSKDIEVDLLHCHDHMTGLIPFFLKCANNYRVLDGLPVMFTIHNGQYQGAMSWAQKALLPEYHESYDGMLDWDGMINPLATALKCAWRVNTVSPSYMKELMDDFGNLTPLINAEADKCIGILNGIDSEVWNPKTDPMIDSNMETSIDTFKSKNKAILAKKVGLSKNKIIISYIGRLAYEKGADLLIPAVELALAEHDELAFVILGSGDPEMAEQLKQLEAKYKKNVKTIIAYDEELAHQIYAGSDFLVMPSRFEPCGLNQMYAMKYGTIPIARYTGGLKDTVPDISVGGNGLSFDLANEFDFHNALSRARILYINKKDFIKLRYKIVDLDFSWQQSAMKYIHQYSLLINA